jgi:UDP-N-acetyl-D-galactosamine dehydrogenase
VADNLNIVVVGLGYVGIPLAVSLARTFDTTGLDINQARVDELQGGQDRTESVDPATLSAEKLSFTTDVSCIADADVVIVAVPTPVDDSNVPDMALLEAATLTVGQQMSAGTTVIYESTVYPGATEDVCVPILESASGQKSGEGFKVGYSPERINPGDGEHSLRSVVKIISAQDDEAMEIVERVYSSVADAGLYKAKSIRVAEAAKVLENTQRDVNIALVNELSVLFHRMGIETSDVLNAAGTKWNFQKYTPGLVGGHCIGVDPYYMSYAASLHGLETEMVLAGRRINNSMSDFVVDEMIKELSAAGIDPGSATVLVLGITYKADVPDTRNSLVIPVLQELAGKVGTLKVHDPLVGVQGFKFDVEELEASPFDLDTRYDAIILAEPHRTLSARSVPEMLGLLRDDTDGALFMDIKSTFDRASFEDAGVRYWTL